ncbi:MAG TPA: thioredoxin domain-containing protein, partial [Gammaproteobacteria bacterium]|nr:thioredoxin domain-containing protein [Gammaproteobacteria bacterium]
MPNRLAQETSPYLQQHAENPVDWYPWSSEALDRARAEDKPILLSIGYSACHWCHVMAHESFEDEETAALMNQLFVNIKVDREERPDLDRIYQTAHQLYTGRAGGWPLTCFLTPDDHVPIVVGTYFPKEPRYGMSPFKQVLEQVEAYYRRYPDEVEARGAALREAFGRMEAGSASAAQLSPAPIERARERLAATFDPEHGGFGGAPKFPHTTALELLLELGADESAGAEGEERRIVDLTLERMALGGLYDQLAGGFFRYSVDRSWSIPHFEKMLYDNAQLLSLYSDAYAATRQPLYARIAGETADFIVRDMQDRSGGYYSTIDADSEGEEGKYYLWTPAEVDALLAAPDAALAKRVLGLDGPANFEDREWHLHRKLEPEAAARQLGLRLDAEAAVAAFAAARRTLLAAREKRVPPGRDEKILVSWNGLMIRGMAKAARRLGRADLAASASRAADFIRTELWRDGRLVATYKDGRARLAAYLDDYAFLAAGLLELLEVRWRSEDLELAVGCADAVLAHFADPAGGFFFTSDDHETLIHRPKPLADEAVPSGNAVMLRVLLELGALIGEQRYVEAAEKGLAAAAESVGQYPDAHAATLLALARHLEPPEIVVVRGEPSEVGPWRELLDEGYAPRRSSF